MCYQLFFTVSCLRSFFVLAAIVARQSCVYCLNLLFVCLFNTSNLCSLLHAHNYASLSPLVYLLLFFFYFWRSANFFFNFYLNIFTLYYYYDKECAACPICINRKFHNKFISIIIFSDIFAHWHFIFQTDQGDLECFFPSTELSFHYFPGFKFLFRKFSDCSFLPCSGFPFDFQERWFYYYCLKLS